MKIRFSALLAGLMLLVAATAGAQTGPPAASTAPAAPAAPCLAGDPFDLAALTAAISNPNPPTAPVTIGRHIVAQTIRKGTLARGGDEALATGRTAPGPKEPRELPPGQAGLDNVPLRIFNTRTQFEFRVTFSDELLRTIGDCHEKQGLSGPGGAAARGAVEGMWASYLPALFGPPRAQTGGAAYAVAPDGWSNGDDSRALRTPTTAWPWRTINQSTFSTTDTQSRCSMTYVGPRHLITAAHCLVDFGTSNWKARTLTPGRDGQNVMPYGQTQITPNPPAGVESWYIVPDPWLDPSTDSSGTEEFQWDIGMVLTVDRLGEQTGWMGYGAFPSTDLNTRNQLNRGYPRCDVQEAPDNCQAHRLYGDAAYCEIGYYHHPGSNGWNREFAFSCDISRGHSGSPLYHYRWIPSWNATGPYVAAVVSWHECLDDAPGECDEDDDFPNHARRITPWARDAVSWLKEQFP